MNINFLLKIAQIFLAIFMVLLVLAQSKNAGLSYGLKNSFNMYRSLRGVERVIFISTIVVGIMLVINSTLLVTTS